MCVNRLTAGQAPACVRACPNGAIRITVVDQQDVKKNNQEYVRLPDTPASDPLPARSTPRSARGRG